MSIYLFRYCFIFFLFFLRFFVGGVVLGNVNFLGFLLVFFGDFMERFMLIGCRLLW